MVRKKGKYPLRAAYRLIGESQLVDVSTIEAGRITRLEVFALDDRATAMARFAALQARAAMRLRRQATPPVDDEVLLTIEDAAARLAVSKDWLRRRPELPFVVKLSEGVVRYSSRRLATYIARQSAR